MSSMKDGWNLFVQMAMDPDSPEIQVSECRKAFYSGARYLFHEIVTGFKPGPDPVQADLDMLNAFNAELDQFGKDCKEGKV